MIDISSVTRELRRMHTERVVYVVDQLSPAAPIVKHWARPPDGDVERTDIEISPGVGWRVRTIADGSGGGLQYRVTVEPLP